MTKSKKSKSKKSDLRKDNFVKTNISKTDFLIFKTKKAFKYISKTFINTFILRHYNLKLHIYIKTNFLRYVIDEVLS